jgi:hypothetical protein
MDWTSPPCQHKRFCASPNQLLYREGVVGILNGAPVPSLHLALFSNRLLDVVGEGCCVRHFFLKVGFGGSDVVVVVNVGRCLVGTGCLRSRGRRIEDSGATQGEVFVVCFLPDMDDSTLFHDAGL